MGLLTVEGTYRDGKVVLDETPQSVQDSARVLVTFVPATNGDSEESQMARREARERLLARLETGLHLGGAPYLTREEIYDERTNRSR